MPTLQVLRREQDPQAQFIQNSGNDISSAIRQSHALDMTSQYYKILAKNSDIEQEKTDLQRKSNFADALKEMPNLPPQARPMYIKMLQDTYHEGNGQQFMQDYADVSQKWHEYANLGQGQAGQQQGQGGAPQPQQQPPQQMPPSAAMSMVAPNGQPSVGNAQGQPLAPYQQQMQPSPAAPGMNPMAGGGQSPSQPGQTGADQDQGEQTTGTPAQNFLQAMQQNPITPQDQLATAQTQQANQEANLNAVRARMMQNPGATTQAVMQAMNAGSPSGQNSTGNDLSGAPNQMMLKGGSIDPTTGQISLQMSNPAVGAMEARSQAVAEGQGKKMVDLEGLKNQYSAYKDALDGAINEQGGPQTTALSAQIAGMKGDITKHFTPNSNIDKVDNMLTPLSVRITSLANSGRGNLPEVQADANLLPNRHTQQATNEFRDKMMQSIFNIQQPQQAYQGIKQIQSVNAKDAAATKAMQAKGYSSAQIDATLRQLHQEEGL